MSAFLGGRLGWIESSMQLRSTLMITNFRYLLSSAVELNPNA